MTEPTNQGQASNLLAQAIEFRKAFELSNDFSVAGFALQQRLISEEYYEVIGACAESIDQNFNVVSRVELLKELGDLVFVCFQMASYMGLDLNEAIKRIFESNMSKLDKNGKPIRREDGKVLKGPDYQPPYLVDLISDQSSS